MKAAVISMQKDEGAILPAWLSYYDRLVGLENVHIIDNGSEDDDMKAALARAAEQGVNVSYRPGRDVFDQKGPIVQALARRLGRYDVILPLDADEFLAVVDGNAIDCRPDAVHEELQRFASSNDDIGLIRTVFPNVPGTTKVRRNECRKVIIRPTSKRPLTKGFHFPKEFRDGYETRLCQIHFHSRGSVEEMRRSALLKLPENAESLDLRDYRKQGFHMKGFLKMTEEQYRARHRSSDGLDVSGIFAELGHEVPYSVWSDRNAGEDLTDPVAQRN